jgi:hypothetical protein
MGRLVYEPTTSSIERYAARPYRDPEDMNEYGQPVSDHEGKQPPKPSSSLEKAYEPKPQERAQVAAYLARKQQKPASPRLTLKSNGNTLEVSADHPMPSLGQTLVMQAIGVTDPILFDTLVTQLINVGTQGQKPDERGLNAVLAMVRAVEPKDEAEAMLAAQMAAVHMATMAMARRLNRVDDIAQQDSASNAFNKLARTFAVQLEALKRYRTGGEQRVTVQHVTVNEGGQAAIVGSVSPPASGVGATGNREATS